MTLLKVSCVLFLSGPRLSTRGSQCLSGISVSIVHESNMSRAIIIDISVQSVAPVRGPIASVAAIVGDITPHDGVSDDEKYKLENSAIEKIRQTLGTDQLAGEELFGRHSDDARMCVFFVLYFLSS